MSEEQGLPPISEEVQVQLQHLQEEVSASFQRGYEEGRKAQAEEDNVYREQANHLRELVNMYAAEVKMLRGKLSD